MWSNSCILVTVNTTSIHHYSFRDCTLWANHVFTFFEILLMDSIISERAIVLLMVQKITTGGMSLTLVHGTGNGGWHIQYRESGRAKYFCQASGFSVKRCGWRVHLGLDLSTALWKLTPGKCFSFVCPCWRQSQGTWGEMRSFVKFPKYTKWMKRQQQCQLLKIQSARICLPLYILLGKKKLHIQQGYY